MLNSKKMHMRLKYFKRDRIVPIVYPKDMVNTKEAIEMEEYLKTIRTPETLAEIARLGEEYDRALK